MKKIFLTGSTGLLGLSLYSQLKKKFKILRISNNKKYNLSKSIKYLPFNSKEKIKKFIKKEGLPDYFIHCGWGKMDEPSSDYHIKENVKFSKNLIDCFFSYGLDKFVFIGTINEYGDNLGIVKENTKPKGKLRNYEKGKAIVGIHGKSIANKLNKKFIHLRVANLFGPITKKKSLIFSMHASNKKNKNVEVSALKFYRDYLHVDSVAKYILKILLNCNSSCVVNVGSGKKILMRNFVKLYWKILNKNRYNIKFSKDINLKVKPGFFMDISKLKSITKSNLKRSLLKEIKTNIEQFKI